MVRQAAWLFGLNTFAKGLAFVGSAYAAKCLGPANLGISALVLSLSQFVGVVVGGGLDAVAVRRIARDPGCARSLTKTIVGFRIRLLAVILPLGLGAALVCFPWSQALAWSAGALLPLVTALGLVFVFQGLERLPMQALVSVLTSMLAALGYFLFRPGMLVGSDLAVMALSGLVGVAVSFRLFNAISREAGASTEAPCIKALLVESRPYWALAVVVYCYFSLQIPLVGYMAGNKMLGVYRSALLLSAGLDLFYYSINALLLPRLVAWHQHGHAYLWSRQRELFGLFLLLGGGVSAVLIWTAPPFYHRFFGAEFEGAIRPFQILVVGRLVVFVGQIYAFTLTALHLDRQFFWASLAGAVFSISANLLLVPRFGIAAAAVVSVLAEILVHGLCYVAVKRYIVHSAQSAVVNPS